MAYRLLGKDFTPSDVVAKVTGSAKYAEDFRVDGMLFSKLWLSPMPHGRVRNIDASEALAMDGVIGILTADDLPETAEPNQPVLTNEPMYVGQPILALAAVDETIAPTPSTRSRSTCSRCHSCWIRSTACIPGAKTPARTATSSLPRKVAPR